MTQEIFPKVSVVIATYNAASCLREALDSVCALQFDKWECVVVDGASKDETMDIVREYAAREPRIRFVSEPDKGIYDAFNKGWQMARGEYVYYLGADDTLHPDCFARCFRSLPTADVVYGDVDYRVGRKTYSSPSHFQPARLRKANLCSHQAMIMRRETIERLGGFDMQYRITADFDLLQRAYLRGCSFAWVEVNFGVHGIDGVSGSFRSERDCYRVRRNNQSLSPVQNWFYTAYTYYMRARSYIIIRIKTSFKKPRIAS